jgi:hypothetical protein
MAEEVECLPGTCEVPSSNPSTTKKKKKSKNSLKIFYNLKCKTVTTLGKHKKLNMTWCLGDEF